MLREMEQMNGELGVAADLNCPEMAGVSCPSVPTYSDVKPIIKHRI